MDAVEADFVGRDVVVGNDQAAVVAAAPGKAADVAAAAAVVVLEEAEAAVLPQPMTEARLQVVDAAAELEVRQKQGSSQEGCQERWPRDFLGPFGTLYEKERVKTHKTTSF